MAKKAYNLDELRAFKLAFNGDITRKDRQKLLWLPAFVSGGLCVLFLTPGIHWTKITKTLVMGSTTYISDGKFSMSLLIASLIDNIPYFIAALVFGLLGYLYGKKVIMPLSIEQEYKAIQFDEKNRFINSLTQLLTNEEMSVFNCLVAVVDRTNGQFKGDLQKLIASLRSSDPETAVIIFNDFCERYRDDLIFIQFMDQVLIAFLEGRNNIDTIQNIKDYHNEIKVKQAEFLQAKQNLVQEVTVYFLLIVGMIIFFHFVPMGFNQYVDTFARSAIGWVSFAIYYGILFALFNKLVHGFYDDNVLSRRM